MSNTRHPTSGWMCVEDQFAALEMLPPVVRRAVCDADYDWHPANWLTDERAPWPVGAALKDIRLADCQDHQRITNREKRVVLSRYGDFVPSYASRSRQKYALAA